KVIFFNKKKHINIVIHYINKIMFRIIILASLATTQTEKQFIQYQQRYKTSSYLVSLKIVLSLIFLLQKKRSNYHWIW
ncbi:MAG: hypothetical protein ACI86H_001199, partial [bacterium]